MIEIFIFLFGLAVGSFLNCLIYRLEKKESFVVGRSHCPYCQRELSFLDLIPIFSFFILKGKCRYCQKPISWQYPLVELSTGLLFLLIFNHYFTETRPLLTSILDICFLFIICCFLIIIFVYDLKHYLIPDQIIYPAIAITFLYQMFGTLGFRISDLFRVSSFEFRIFNTFLNFLFAGLGAGFFFLLIFLISKGKWLGFGDFKLAILMGLILGWPNILVALFLAFLFGAIIGIGLIASGKKTMKSEVPFAPFLVSGTFIALFWAKEIINWYGRLFS